MAVSNDIGISTREISSDERGGEWGESREGNSKAKTGYGIMD